MFDPYRKWLGITAKDLPPNHYRLLGLENFESDLDVIEGAADRQMSFIRQYQSGEHSVDAAKILNELAMARLCLLKPATKAAYDAKLRKEIEPAVEEMTLDLPFPSASPTSRKKNRASSKKNSSNQQLLICGGAGLVVCCLLAVFLLSGSRKKPERVVGTDPSPAEKPAVVEPKPIEKKPEAPAASEFAWREETQRPQPVGETIDLIKTVEFPKHAINGVWEQTSTALIGPPGGQMYFPVRMPEDYQLKYSVRRVEGADTLFMGFVMSGRQGIVVLDGWGATKTGLCVDGREPSDNCTTLPRKLLTDELAEIILTVHPGHCHLAVDGKTIFDWHGNSERLSSHFSIANRETPFLNIANAKYIIESARLIRLKPVAAPTRIVRLDREIDVMPLIDTDRDVRRGIWGINKGTLSSPDNLGQIYLPTVVPEEYTLSATVELPTNNPNTYSLAVGLVVGNEYVQFHDNQQNAGLDMINGQRFTDGEARLEGQWIKPGIPNRLRCTVTKDAIVIDINDKTVVDWSGDRRLLEMSGDWALADARRLFLGSLTHLKFRDIKLGPPIERVKLPNAPSMTVGKAVDLLALIDPARDALTGAWERDGKNIRTLADVVRSKLVVPLEPPTDYKLTLQVAREPGGPTNDQALFINLPTAGEKAIVAFDASGKTVSGSSLDGPRLDVPPLTWRGVAIEDGPAQELTCIVRGTGIKVLKGEQTIFEWTGSPHRYVIDSQYKTPGNKIGLISWNSRFRIEKLELEPLPPVTFPEPASLDAEGNLLSIINLDRDVRMGSWTLGNDGLISDKTRTVRVHIPAPVPDRYTVTFDIERKEGTDGFKIGLPMRGHVCEVPFDNYNGRLSGLALVDGKFVNDGSNFTRRQHSSAIFPIGKRVSVRCQVTTDSVIVTVDGQELVRWHGDARRLSIRTFMVPPKLLAADQSKIWFCTWDASFQIHECHLQPMTEDEAKELEAQFDGVFPMSAQPDFVVVAATPASVKPKMEPTVAKPKPASNLLPIPSKAELEAARVKVMKSMAGDLKLAQDVNAKVELATKLMDSAANVQEPATERYAYYTEAIDVYSSIGDLMSAFRAIDTIKVTFDVASLEEKSELLQRIAKKAKTPLQNRYIVFVALKLAADAAAEENYQLGKEVCGKAVIAARTAGDAKVQAHAVEQAREVESLLSQYRAAKLAEEDLKANPNDAAANKKIGEYRCWVRRDWENGLSALRHTSDTRLQPIVTADIANPTTPDAQAAVAQSWLGFAKGQKVDVVKEAAAERAATWFEKALPGLSANKKASAEADVDLAYELASGRDFKKLLSRPANGVEALSSFDCRSEMHPMTLKPSFEFGKSWMLSLQFKPMNLDGGWHQIFFWGDGAGGDDPLWVRIDGTRLSAVIENVIENRGQGIDYYVPGNLQGEWIDLKFIYDAVGGNLELYINHRLIRRESLAIIPAIDRGMPMYVGGADGDTQRFHGFVRNIWLGNIP